MKTQLENLEYEGGGKLEKIPCPLCKGAEFKTIVVEQGLPVVRCVSCQLAFANPRPDHEGLMKFYKDYFPPESASLWQEQMSSIFLREGLERIREYQEKGILTKSDKPKILDIGSGMGFFLDLMKREGWQADGVEPSPSAVKHARESLGLEVHLGTIEGYQTDQLYDVITLWYVMEHVPNPHEILDRVASLLLPGGLVIIRVPNQNAPVDRILGTLGLGKFFLMNPPRHLFDYSPKTLKAFMTQRGFETLEIRNSMPRGTGTFLEKLRRFTWYGTFQALYILSGGRIVRGSSMTLYAKKK